MLITDTTLLNWPPHFTIKKHSRTRHIKLKVSLKNGLEFIVPLKFNPKEIPLLLEKHKQWIMKQLLKFHIEKSHLGEETLPKEIILTAINQHWRIDYIESGKKLQVITRPHHELVLFGNIENKLTCKNILITWVKNLSQIFLPLQLTEISQQTQLPFNHVTIRDQSTRWGSCSSTKSINLNYQLIFFPPALARHVMIHELCHTIHMNHSNKFWELVAKFDPNWQANKQLLKKAAQYVPVWIRK